MSTVEQVSISFRHVGEDLSIEETFMGFYSTSSTSGETPASIIKDSMIRFNLTGKNLMVGSRPSCRRTSQGRCTSTAGIIASTWLCRIPPKGVHLDSRHPRACSWRIHLLQGFSKEEGGSQGTPRWPCQPQAHLSHQVDCQARQPSGFSKTTRIRIGIGIGIGIG